MSAFDTILGCRHVVLRRDKLCHVKCLTPILGISQAQYYLLLQFILQLNSIVGSLSLSRAHKGGNKLTVISYSFRHTDTLASHEDGLQREAKSSLRTLSPAALEGTGVSLFFGLFYFTIFVISRHVHWQTRRGAE